MNTAVSDQCDFLDQYSSPLLHSFCCLSSWQSTFIAYLDSSETDMHVQQVGPGTFTTVSSVVTSEGAKEAGGLVAHEDGLTLLTNEALPSGTVKASSDSTPVAVLYRYPDCTQAWKTFLGGPDCRYSGSVEGHYGDSVQYVKADGTLTAINGVTSS
ncbi:hypothetical protein F5Y07DRAFT_404975 [Xylaria sp. FL0933]|nr:hypothetical protein F5Y07DRAFT_404975 [Xylaria sp. FL0933]